MKRAVLFCITALLSVSAQALDDPLSLRRMADAIRDGQINVGKEYSMGDEGRFHVIHSDTLGIKCAGCHQTPAYPDNYLYLRNKEFPHMTDGERVRAVKRATCIGCHSDKSVATPFYNVLLK